MPHDAPRPPTGAFLAAAEQAARARPGVDVELAREVMLEAATMVHNSLALDGLDEHDTDAVVAGLSAALVSEDPAAAVRACSQAALDEPAAWHDPPAVSAAYLVVAAVLQL